MVPMPWPPQIELNGDAAHLVPWLCDPFDQTYSFRQALLQIERTLAGMAPVGWTLPPEQPAEDFVDGSFQSGRREFVLYVERSLGYMQFSSTSPGDIAELGAAMSAGASSC